MEWERCGLRNDEAVNHIMRQTLTYICKGDSYSI